MVHAPARYRGTSLKSRLRLATMLVTIGVTLLAAAMALAAVDTGWPPKSDDLAPDTSLLYGRLPNGVRYALMPNREPKERVSLHLVIQAGSLVEDEGQRGWAHYLEHMLFNGSTHFAPGELVKYFQEIGMQFGPDANARTGFHETVFDILLPRASEESLRQGLTVLRDWADGALLLPEEIERERKVILAEKRARDSAGYRTYVRTLQFELPEARLSHRLPIGEEESLRRADAKGLRDFYRTWYRPEAMVVVAVGEFDPPAMAELISQAFGSMVAQTPPQPSFGFGRLEHRGSKPFYHHEVESGGTRVGIEVLTHAPHEPDSRARQRDELLQDLASLMIQFRLDAALRKPGAPFTSASVDAGRMLREIRFAEIAADCLPENWPAVLAAIEQTLRAALVHGFSGAELERARKEVRAGLDKAVERAATRDSNMLARAIIGSLAEGRIFISPQQRRDLLAPVLDACTSEEVENALRRDWSPAHRLVLLTGNADLSKVSGGAERELAQAYARSGAIAVAPPVAMEQAQFPYLAPPGRSGEIVARQFQQDLNLEEVTFGNGTRLTIKQTDFKADEVWVNLTFGAGRASEPEDKPGLSGLSVDLLAESGLGGLDRDQLERALAGKTAAVTPGVEEDRFVLRGRCRSGELELLFQLLYAHLQDPGFRPEAFQLVRQRYAQHYEEIQRSIDGAMQLKGQRFLAGEDSRFGQPAREVFWRLTLEDARNFLAPLQAREPIEITAVGDLKPDEAIVLAARYFGSLPQRNLVAAGPRPGVPGFPTARSLSLRVPTRIPKGLVVVAYPTSDVWDISRSRRLSLLAEVLSDRLRETIREKLGAAYSPDAYSFASRAYPGFGYLRAEVETDPEDAERVVAAIRGIVVTLVREGVSADELRRALNPTLTGLKTAQRRNGYWLNQVLTGASRHPEQLDWSRTMMTEYPTITADELSALARTYLVDSSAAVILVRPEGTADTAPAGDARPAAEGARNDSSP